MHKIYKMKKSIILLLLVQFTFAQKLTKDEVLEKVATQTCTCLSQKDLTQDNVDITLGICMIEAIQKNNVEVEKYFGKNIISDDEKMSELAESIGVKLAFNCPSFLEIIKGMDSDEFQSDEASEDLYLSGKIIATKAEQFLSFTLKEDTGKTHTFLVLEDFDNSYLLTDGVVKPSDKVEITYYEAILYDAKIKKFVPFNVVLDITKK